MWSLAGLAACIELGKGCRSRDRSITRDSHRYRRTDNELPAMVGRHPYAPRQSRPAELVLVTLAAPRMGDNRLMHGCRPPVLPPNLAQNRLISAFVLLAGWDGVAVRVGRSSRADPRASGIRPFSGALCGTVPEVPPTR